MGAAVKKKLTVAAAFFGGGANSTGLLSPGKPALVADDILCTGRRDVASRLHAFFFLCTHVVVQKRRDSCRVTHGAMPRNCCVPLCNTNARKGPLIRYHEFPLDAEHRKTWLRNISRQGSKGKGSPWEPSDRSLVCSLCIHFTDDDYRSQRS